ncbi:hypothetical protein Q8A67_022106 [Cirrhinus molitorella]|uniref:Uncharacterized protein n=1 Tax=Cirrhinus molitorella TaxID=172907 RepID=A0AA88TEW3_9TELE|nr:hypothetical protein Q8A67_022106 [Cirrhinus molitorella]
MIHTENSWSIRIHRPAKTNRTQRKMEARNERQSSESQEKSRQKLVRCNSMDRIKPLFSDDPDGPANFNSNIKAEVRFSHQNPSACSQEQTTSLRHQQLKT